jgi:hypothetical protein
LNITHEQLLIIRNELIWQVRPPYQRLHKQNYNKLRFDMTECDWKFNEEVLCMSLCCVEIETTFKHTSIKRGWVKRKSQSILFIMHSSVLVSYQIQIPFPSGYLLLGLHHSHPVSNNFFILPFQKFIFLLYLLTFITYLTSHSLFYSTSYYNIIKLLLFFSFSPHSQNHTHADKTNPATTLHAGTHAQPPHPQ